MALILSIAYCVSREAWAKAGCRIERRRI